jgi:N-acetylneuraminate synthase
MDGPALSELIEGSKTIFRAKGHGKRAVKEEGPTIAFAFASVVITQPISANEIFTEKNIFPMRPAGGDFSVSDYQSVLGKTAATNLTPGRQLQIKDVK